MPAPAPVPDSDAESLARFGYQQQLKRTIRGFSSFALSFSLISMTTGIFANFGLGIREFGPGLLWSWTLVLCGQILVALVLAELSVHYPLSGYGYQWSSRLISPKFGFFVGWVLLLQFLTGFPGVCSAMGEYINGYYGATLPAGLTVPVITVMLITTAALIHLFGIKLAAFFNDAGVVAEIVGSVVVAAALLVLFGFTREDGFAFLTVTTNHRTGAAGGFAGFTMSLLVGAWCLTGFEAAADLAEETKQPARVVPRAILVSLISSGIGGFLMLAGFILAIEDLAAVQASPTPLADILQARLGAPATHAVLFVVFVSIFACALASMAACTRLLFSMARDRMLPGSRFLASIHEQRGTPSKAIAAVWAVSSVVVLTLEKLELITSISAVAAYLGYAGILVAALKGLRGKAAPDGFHLGRWRSLVGGAALVWVLFLAAALTWPKADPEIGSLPLRTSLAALGIGVVVYFAVIRGRLRRGEAGPPLILPSQEPPHAN